jgi:acyl-CoA synthetase (AMP-forming)/AMP-acid ligase II
VFTSLVDMVRTRADTQGGDTAFWFLLDGEAAEEVYTYAHLDERARALAARLQREGRAGDRAVILMAPGPMFVVAFFGCLYAGMIAVPAFLPDVTDAERSIPRLRSIAQDAEATCILTDELFVTFRDHLWAAAPGLARTPWVLVAEATSAEDPGLWRDPNAHPEDVAFIQYTSGSTASPKGVVLSHSNLIANSAAIEGICRLGEESIGVSWLPPYHDMGLIGGVLQPLYQGRPMALMSPMDFLTRPRRWLQAITRYSATWTGAPNFAFELCVRRVPPEQRDGLDLSSLQVAINGAEPIRAATLSRFDAAYEPHGWRPTAMTPCYGLAESSVMATYHDPRRAPVVMLLDRDALAKGTARPAQGELDGEPIVACGTAPPLHELRIVDPDTATELSAGEVGEIWVRGPSVGSGYWGRRRETETVFAAHLDTGEGPFLRTGDLGFLHDDQLYVAGRIKDLIIIRGRNLHPHDIEQTVERVPGVRAGCVAAFPVTTGGMGDGDGTDAAEGLGVVAEVKELSDADLDDALSAVRSVVTEEHLVAPSVVAFIPARSLAKTSSGKVRRHAVRESLRDGTLPHLAIWPARSGMQERHDD